MVAQIRLSLGEAVLSLYNPTLPWVKQN